MTMSFSSITPSAVVFSCSCLFGPSLHVCRGQGVGTAVVKKLLATPAAAHTDVFLTTISRSIRFYQRAGFEEVDRRNIPR